MAMRWMQVTIDGCKRTTRALADPEDTWNGFLNPWFPLSSFAAINDMLGECGTGERLMYEPGENVAVVTCDGEDVERFDGMHEEGLWLFPVGAGGWTWVEAKED